MREDLEECPWHKMGGRNRKIFNNYPENRTERMIGTDGVLDNEIVVAAKG